MKKGKKKTIKRERSRDRETKNVNQELQIKENIKIEELTTNFNIREICVENIPESLSNEKIYEIFFIFGDITKIEFIKQQKKAFIKYKYCYSAVKAFKKLNSPKHNTKNVKVELSNPLERPDIQQDEGSELKNEGKVIYLKFDDANNVPEKEEIKKLLKRYGTISKIFRKKEGRSYYIEFTAEESSSELINDYNNGTFVLSKKNGGLMKVDYAFNKGVNEEVKEMKEVNINEDNNNIKTEEQERPIENINEQKDQVEQLDPNKHWQVYYDNTYQRNFYYNPFFNQSLWELPEGAEISKLQNENYLYDPQINVEENKEVVDENVLNQEEKEDFYDDDAWEEEELREKILWDKMKEQQLKEWMKRPARQQVTDTRRDTAYIEGNYDYNIWYDKYLTDRKEEKEKIPAMHKCNPALDTGFTRADIQEKEGGAYFCLYFAKGCCSEGVNCRYYHRIPTKNDVAKIENLRDVFGRSRFATHRNDMGGVGTFTKECRTVFITDIKMIEIPNPVKEMVRIIYENFSPWGEIEDINYIPAKATCFIRYSHRCFAEFAKEAMMDQSLIGEEILSVKWAYDDPNPMNKVIMEKEHQNKFLSSYQRKKENMKKINQNTNNKPLPNTDYYRYYNNINNPYAYDSGYGIEEGENQQVVNEITKNCVKLTETLQAIEENYKDIKQN